MTTWTEVTNTDTAWEESEPFKKGDVAFDADIPFDYAIPFDGENPDDYWTQQIDVDTTWTAV